MCRVSVEVNESALSKVNPNLNNVAALSKWVQQLVDFTTRELVGEDTRIMSVEEAKAKTLAAVRREYALERDLTPEQLYAVIMEDVKAIYEDDSI